jgi:hypothetical protein
MTQLKSGEITAIPEESLTGSRPAFRIFAWRVIALHTLTYFLVGLAAFFILDYRRAFEATDLQYLMKPTTSPWVAAGPALQPIRGLLFALVLYPFAAEFIHRRRGALILWGLLLGLAVFGTAGPSPGSLEGILYTKLPLRLHLFGLPEVILQTLLFSVGLVTWSRRPRKWKDITGGIGVGLVILMSTAGVLLA